MAHYPYHPKGRPDPYAYRQAMQIRLNGIESTWLPLKAPTAPAAVGKARESATAARLDIVGCGSTLPRAEAKM